MRDLRNDCSELVCLTLIIGFMCMYLWCVYDIVHCDSAALDLVLVI